MTQKYIIKGGNPLIGTVTISGSKNSALPILAATLLTEEEVTLHNIPQLRDVTTMVKLLEKLGKKITRNKNSLTIQHLRNGCYHAHYDMVTQMRASICVLGPLLAKQKKAHISFPGGCVFGPRPIDLHLEGLKQMGVTIENHHGYLESRCTQLVGGKINLLGEFGTSVLATDNVLSAATLAKGVTVIENAAKEPETIDLVNFLQFLGAKIKGVGHSTIEIEGVNKLHGGEYCIIQDRIEAGTFIVFAAMTQGEVQINYRYPEHLKQVLALTKTIGLDVSYTPDQILVSAKNFFANFKAFTLTTLPYPHFPTDLQPLFSTLATLISGNSTITEKIYPNRFSHTAELVRMGGEVQIKQNSAIISGVSNLEGAKIQASDLRGCAALIAAGLAATNTTEVRRIYHGQRGYENIVEKLTKLNGNIKMDKDELL